MMEKLIINIPEKKSALVKQILKGLGVTIQQESNANALTYQQKLTKVSTWSDNDLEVFENTKNAFKDFSSEQW